MTDFELMGAALDEARKAAALGEVPVGAVVAKDGEIVAAAHNTRETEKNALHHAELLAIDAACKKLGGWRLWQCELFVTLEPCPMCSGAIINSRIKRVVYGAADVKAGCCGSVHFFRSSPVLWRARWRLCGFDKFPLNNIAQSGEKRKWAPAIFSRSSHFFHRFKGSQAVSSGALRPAWPAARRKTPAKAAAPRRPAALFR